ncbi:Transcriptional regulator [Luteitalea pratensis]|uniref:Transcriptional regulator n=1 Tax=Luteitalea pratensis TaxID=1855912 RepID=A0A143PF37_LUTPR|nr:helix-turn-helix domain-containing protein [Luteitalea pratensis]AMY07131.1 Transcriptional regulator [Luteitalea pratensis]
MSVLPRVPIVLSEYQREQLIRWVSAPGTPARVVRRSRIILQLASGYSVHRASQVLSISEPTIRLWRDRFRFGGLDALTTDAPRPGRPRRARGEASTKVSECLAAMPQGTHLSVRALARETGLGRHLVQQILIDMELLPRAVRSRPSPSATPASAPRSDHS